MRHRQTKVYLALSWYEPDHMMGINRYACDHNWVLQQSFPNDTSSLQRFQPHGIICQLARYVPQLIKAVESAHVPTVELCDAIPDMRLPRVMPDAEALGALAAAHLLERGFTRCVFIGYSTARGYQRGFTEAIRTANGECRVVEVDSADMERETGEFLTATEVFYDEGSALRRKWARRFFAKCDKPVGVYVQSTVWASDIIEGCRAARILVPEQVAVVSLADMAGAGASWTMPLTVVVQNYQEQGFQAARLLDRMIQGEPIPPDTLVKIPPASLVPRDSTLCHATDNLAIARATAFIMRNLHDPGLCVKQVQRAARAPRSSIYREFIRQFNMPIARYIERLRIRKALHQLETTDATVNVIAVRNGFGKPLRFRHAFVREKGMTPSAYRHRQAGAPTSSA